MTRGLGLREEGLKVRPHVSNGRLDQPLAVLASREPWIRRHTPIWKSSSEIIGFVIFVGIMIDRELVGQRYWLRHHNFTNFVGEDMFGDGDLARGGVKALPLSVERFHQGRDTRIVPPAFQTASGGNRVGVHAETDRRVDLLKRDCADRNVGSVAIDKIKVPEAVTRQRQHIIFHHSDNRGGLQRHRPCKPQMKLRHSNTDRWCHKRPRRFTQPSCNGFGTDRIRPDQAVGPMLLSRSDWNDDAGGVLQVGFDLSPCGQMKLHSWSNPLAHSTVKLGSAQRLVHRRRDPRIQ